MYYKDSYLKNTTATILGRHRDKKSWWYAFDKTIFYPGGGGQSPDEGFINSEKLLNIREENNVIWHELNTELTDTTVTMAIAWPKRIRRMQQHSGQHLASAVFYREYGINTVSVHLGQSDTLIEFDHPDISPEILNGAEDLANSKIREDVVIKSSWVPKKKLDDYDLRRDIAVESDPVRLIQIGDYDVTGCGGTHIGSTAEIGLLKIIGTEKIRRHTRVHFRIGESAYQLFAHLVRITQKISNELSSGYEDLESKISKLITEQKELRRMLHATRKNWLILQAQQLSSAENAGFFVLTELSQDELVEVSLYWFDKFKKPCLFLCQKNNKYFFAIRSNPEQFSSAANFVRNIGPRFNLKGGGSGEFVQGIITRDVVDDAYLGELKKTFEQEISNK